MSDNRVMTENWFGEVPLQFEWITNDDIGDLIPLEEFFDNVEDGLFIDYDGNGELAYANMVSNILFVPSTLKDLLEKWKDFQFTHVMWYNR